MNDDHDLRQLNEEIGNAEARGDHEFFEATLAPAFCMVRPDGLRFNDRADFLAALGPGPQRHTRVECVVTYDNRAVVTSAVGKGERELQFHRNIRVFSRADPNAPWQLVAWVTEPLPGFDF